MKYTEAILTRLYGSDYENFLLNEIDTKGQSTDTSNNGFAL